MKLSRSKLNEYVKLYLNDVHDYGDDNEYELVESILLPLTNTLEESEQDLHSLLKEASKSSPEHKNIILEFIEYSKSI
jgi:hypothetical protein